jgi:hypothetical protein
MTGSAVTLISTEGTEAVVAASDDAARACAELEFAMGEGPARDAFARGRPVLVPELGGPQDGSWTGFGPAAYDVGVRAVFAVPLQVGAVRFGVLSLYDGVPRRLAPPETTRVLALAEVATEMLLDSSAATSHGEIDPDLDQALGFRGEVYQAQGMVMVALEVPLPEALARMRGHAFATDRDLLGVALDIVGGRLELLR